MYKKIGTIDSETWKIFYLYVSLYYFLPAIYSAIWYQSYDETFKMPETFLYALMIPVVLICLHLFDVTIPKIKTRSISILRLAYENKILIFVLSAALLGTSIWFAKNFSLSFKHHNSLSEAGGLAKVLITLRTYFRIFIFYGLVKHLTGVRISLFERFVLLNTAACYFLTIMSSFDVLFIFLSLTIGLKRENWFGKATRQTSIRRFITNFTSLVILPIILSSIIYIGIANKIGHEKAQNQLTDTENLVTVYKIIAKRSSTLYVSMLTSGREFFKDPFFAHEALLGTGKNLQLRLCSLIGVNCGTRPNVWSLNRQNYLLLFNQDDRDRTGATPGIFSMVYYVPYFPFSVFIVAIYIIFVLRKISSILKYLKVELSILLKLLIMFFLLPLFENPLAYINFIDTSTVYLVLFLLALSSLSYQIKKTRHVEQTEANY